MSRLDDPALVASEYADESRLRRRAAGYAGAGTRQDARIPLVAAVVSSRPEACARGGLRLGRARRVDRARDRGGGHRNRSLAANGRARVGTRDRCERRGRAGASVPGRGSTSSSRRGCSTTCRISTAAWRRSHVCCVRAGRSSRRRTRASTSRSSATLSAAARRRSSSRARMGRHTFGRTSHRWSGSTSTASSSSRIAAQWRTMCLRRSRCRRSPRTCR